MVENVRGEDLVSIEAGETNSGVTLVAQADLATPEPIEATTAEPARQVILVEEGSILRLPATASIDQPRVNGSDLEFVQADGSVIVVPEGAIQGLTIFIGSVEIPPQAVATLFEANGIEAAAGPEGGNARGSGGNFELPVGGIGDAFDIGDLLPPTELGFDDDTVELLATANDAPIFGAGIFGQGAFGFSLSEEGLSGGLADSNPQGADFSNVSTYTIDLGASDPNNDPLTFTFGQPTAPFTVNGVAVTWEGVDTDTLTGKAGDVTVFEISVGGPSGTVTVTLLQPVDHPLQGEDVVNLGLTVTANDGFGGTATATITIALEDDSPEIGTPEDGIVDEDGLPAGIGDAAHGDDLGGNAGEGRDESTYTGNLNIRWGADNRDAADGLNADGSFAQDSVGRSVYFSQADFDAFVAAHGDLTSNGRAINFSLSANGTIITATAGEGEKTSDIFRISLSDDGTGSYKFQLLGQLDHGKAAEAPPEGGEEEEGPSEPVPVLLRVAAVDPSATEENIDLRVGFTARDADGDIVTGTFGVSVDDDIPKAWASTTVWLDDDDLGGNPGGKHDNPPANHTGMLNFDFGADTEGASISWMTSHISHGGSHGLTYDVVDGGATLLISQNGKLVITATLDQQTGEYSIKQNAPLKHPSGHFENNIELQLRYQVTDGDGDKADSHLWVKIDDDTPKAWESTTVWLDDDDLSGGNPGGSGDDKTANLTGKVNFSFGADSAGASVTWISATPANKDTTGNLGFTSKVNAAGELEVYQYGKLVLSATLDPKTGQFAVTQVAPIKHLPGGDENDVNFKFNFRVTDGDGDVSESHLWVNVDDDTPTIVNTPAGDFNLLTNGDFSQGAKAETYYGHDFVGPMGWTIKGTTPGHEDVKLETAHNGYLGMSSPTGGSMIDLAASPGNVEISQMLSGLDRSKTYNVSFEVGSPDPASAALEVYWNGVKLDTALIITNKMTLVTLTGLVPDDSGRGTLSFKEVGAPDNTGTYLANIALTPAGAVDLPVLTGQMYEGGEATFDLKEGAQFRFGADGAGSVTVDSSAAVLSGPAGVYFDIPQISYDALTGKLTIVPPFEAIELNKGEMATLSIPFSVTDRDGDVRTGLYQVTIKGTNDAPDFYVKEADSDEAALTETNAGLQANGTLTVLDFDSSSKITAKVSFDTASNAGYSLVGAEAFLSLTRTTLVDAHPVDANYHNLGWKFDSGHQAFDFLQDGEELVLPYTITITDEWGASNSHQVAITITGTNDAAVITGGTFAGVTEDGASNVAGGQLYAADVDNQDNVFQAQDNVASAYGKFTIDANGKWFYKLDNANPAVNALNTGDKLIDSFIVKSLDGTEQVVSVEIKGTTDNTPPVITVPSQLNYATGTFVSPGPWENVTYINRLVIADREQVNGPVTVRLALKDGTLEGLSGNGVSVSGNGTRVLTLTGKIADINAFIAGNHVEFDPDLGWPFAGLDDKLTVTVDDGHGGVATSIVAIKHSSDMRSDWSGWNLNEVVAYYGSGNDKVITSWSHGPSGRVLYDGGEKYEWTGWNSGYKDVSSDQITLVTTADQLTEILTKASDRDELDDFLTDPRHDLDLSGTAWNAVVQNFEKAQLAIAAGPNGHVVYAPAANGLPDKVDAGNNQDNLLIAKVSGSLLEGKGGDDILVGRAGADSLKGGNGDDLLLGGAGDDLLSGGKGHDILVGGAGKDTFEFSDHGADHRDTITDYVLGEDEIDLSALLDANAIDQGNIGQSVRIQGEGADAVLQISTAGNGNNWSDVATLSGHGAAGTSIDIRIDQEDFTIKVI